MIKLDRPGPNRLKEVTLPLAETDKDRLRFKDSGGRGVGAGDSGGPAVVKSGHGWKLVGVTSSGGTDPAGVTHSSYTDVSAHQLWIYRTMTGHLP
nr:hypothetical protein [Kibdelosporangium sp. MJ126-NF4]